MRTLSSAVLISAALVWLVCVHAHAHGQDTRHGLGAPVLRPADYRPYVDTFQQQEREATGKLYQGEGGEDAWVWMLQEIPWFEASDKQFEEMYYFRWYAWKKHLVQAPSGTIVTEWLPVCNSAEAECRRRPIGV
jgi:hypothetical protein